MICPLTQLLGQPTPQISPQRHQLRALTQKNPIASQTQSAEDLAKSFLAMQTVQNAILK